MSSSTAFLGHPESANALAGCTTSSCILRRGPRHMIVIMQSLVDVYVNVFFCLTPILKQPASAMRTLKSSLMLFGLRKTS